MRFLNIFLVVASLFLISSVSALTISTDQFFQTPILNVSNAFVYANSTNFCINGACVTSLASIGNVSWNQSFANTLYVPYIGATSNIVLGNNNVSINGTTFFVNREFGFVGIGTISPVEKLSLVGGNIGVDVNQKIILNSPINTSYLIRMSTAPAGTFIYSDGNQPVQFSNGGASIGAYSTTTNPPSNGLIVSGLVGINTTTPSEVLELRGNIYLNNTVNSLIYIGAARDSSFSYNSTDGVWNPKLVGTGKAYILGDIVGNRNLQIENNITVKNNINVSNNIYLNSMTNNITGNITCTITSGSTSRFEVC